MEWGINKLQLSDACHTNKYVEIESISLERYQSPVQHVIHYTDWCKSATSQTKYLDYSILATFGFDYKYEFDYNYYFLVRKNSWQGFAK